MNVIATDRAGKNVLGERETKYAIVLILQENISS